MLMNRLPKVLPKATCRGAAAAGAAGLLRRTLPRLCACSGEPAQAEDRPCMDRWCRQPVSQPSDQNPEERAVKTSSQARQVPYLRADP